MLRSFASGGNLSGQLVRAHGPVERLGMSEELPGTPTQERFRVGCVEIGRDTDGYFRRVNALEYQQTFFQVPKAAALRKLRQLCPDPFTLAIKAPQLITHTCSQKRYPRYSGELSDTPENYGHFQPTPEVARATEHIIDAAAKLGADVIVFETPVSFTPNATHRQWMSQYFENLDRRDFKFAWNPRGLWPEDERQRVATGLDLMACWDPVLEQAPATDDQPTYARVRGLGENRRLSEVQLLRITEQLTRFPTAYCFFEGENMLKHADRLLAMLRF